MQIWLFRNHFFGEDKAPKGSLEVAKRQACYDGAFGARAMHHLQTYGAEETYDRNANTFTFTYSDSALNIYAHHLSQLDGPNTPPHYHMTRPGSWALESSRQVLDDGATAFRNLRDLASDLREQFLADADRRMQNIPQERRERLIEEAWQRVQELLVCLRNGADKLVTK